MGFKNAVDKDAIPTVSILGVNIAAIDMEWLLSFTETNVKELSPKKGDDKGPTMWYNWDEEIPK